MADLLYEDESVTEVLINGASTIYCERGGRLELVERSFADEQVLMAAVQNLAEYVHRRIDDDHHSMDARLPEPDRFRVHVIIPPVSRQGPCISIRKFRRSNTSLEWLISKGALDEDSASYLRLMVQAHRNLIVSGGTGSGKTSLLNALSAHLAPNERILVIEDSSELQLQQPHVVYLEARPPRPDGKGAVTIRDLFVDSLRMRPDRIVVGEVRRGEALDMVQSMLTGHDGAMSTVHASNPLLSLVRLETLCLMSDTHMPVYVARRRSPRRSRLSFRSTASPTAVAASAASARWKHWMRTRNTASATCIASASRDATPTAVSREHSLRRGESPATPAWYGNTATTARSAPAPSSSEWATEQDRGERIDFFSQSVSQAEYPPVSECRTETRSKVKKFFTGHVTSRLLHGR